MRIIAGTHRRRKLFAPADDKVTRPITDRVKQSLFDRLAASGIFEPDEIPDPSTKQETDGVANTSRPPLADKGAKSKSHQGPTRTVGLAVDLFAGVGSLGLEALSRGIATCVFIERNRKICELLERNIANLELDPRSDVMHMDVLGAGWTGLLPRQPIRLLFCDPPYALTQDAVGMSRIINLLEDLAKKVEPGGIAVLRTDGRTQAPTPQGWHQPVTLDYVRMAAHLYARPDEQAENQEPQ